MKKQDDRNVIISDKLNNHPELQSTIEDLLDIAVAKTNTPDLANDIEELIITKTRELAKNTLSKWAKNKHALVCEAQEIYSNVTKSGKKN